MQPKFSSDEKVLCYHGPLLYEAKILKNKKDGGSYTYFVHYQGWNRNWDEWVAETRIMKQVAENFDKQKKLLATHMAQTKAKKQKQKAEKAVKKGKGGSDSGSNSRASTPVSDKPPTERRAGKRNLADDEMSTSSKDDEVSNPPFTTKETRKKNRKEETVEDTVENILSGEIEKKNVFSSILFSFRWQNWQQILHRHSRGTEVRPGEWLGPRCTSEAVIQAASQGVSEQHHWTISQPSQEARDDAREEKYCHGGHQRHRPVLWCQSGPTAPVQHGETTIQGCKSASSCSDISGCGMLMLSGVRGWRSRPPGWYLRLCAPAEADGQDRRLPLLVWLHQPQCQGEANSVSAEKIQKNLFR